MYKEDETAMVRRRLCLVIPSLQAGGMERVMSELTWFFSRKDKVEIHLVLYGKEPEIFYKIPDSILVHMPAQVFDNRFRLYFSLSRLVYLRKVIKRIDPHSILSFGEYWNSFTLLALAGLDLQIYVSDRCSPAKKFGFFHAQLRRWLYPRAGGVIAQTELARQLYKNQFHNERIFVIGNPIHMYGGDDSQKDKIVLTIGRLIKSKNHDKIIEVFCKINRPGWKLVIVGGDALKQNNMSKLRNLVYSLGAESKVFLKGYRTDPEKFYQRSSIFVSASESEGFPNVIGEAMSAGIPVVAFDCISGPSEMIIDGHNGYLVPVNDYCTLSERLERLMDNESLRNIMGARARESITEYSIENIGSKYYDLLINS
ncbi:MAG TPA: glycosyltransferase [Saprospiraceae bacterium]|nr:glycosyltransferase [Saprospiraceae bacterium]